MFLFALDITEFLSNFNEMIKFFYLFIFYWYIELN